MAPPILSVANGHAVTANAGGAAAAPVGPSGVTGDHVGSVTGHHAGSAAGRRAGAGTRRREPSTTVANEGAAAAARLAKPLAMLRAATANLMAGRRDEPAATGTSGGRADWASDLATLAIVVTAGVASWAGWVYLAEAVGWGAVNVVGATFRLSWLLPLSVDVYAFVAARAWLGRNLDADTKAWGRGSAWGALGLSMIGNAGGHAVEAGVWHPTWIAIVIVAMIPPAMLFLALHLRTMRTRDREALANRRAARAARRTTQQSPATPASSSGQMLAANGHPAAARAARSAARARVATSGPAGETADRVRTAYEAAVADGRADAMTAAELAAAIGHEIGSSARTVRRYLARLRGQPGDQQLHRRGPRCRGQWPLRQAPGRRWPAVRRRDIDGRERGRSNPCKGEGPRSRHPNPIRADREVFPMVADPMRKDTSVMAKKEYDLRFRDGAGNPKPPVRVVLDLQDEDTLRTHLIELAVKHDFRKRDRVEEWIGEYALEVCAPGHRRPELVFKAVK